MVRAAGGRTPTTRHDPVTAAPPVRRNSRRRTVLGWTAAGVLAVALALLGVTMSIAPWLFAARHSLGVDPGDVGHVELYEYDFTDDPSRVTRTTISDPGLVAELVDAFTDVPVRGVGPDVERVVGSRAAGVRYVLTDGSAVELTQVFVEPHDVVIVWPDGTVQRTWWGVPLGDYYRDLGPTVEVDPADRPVAALP